MRFCLVLYSIKNSRSIYKGNGYIKYKFYVLEFVCVFLSY